MIFCLLHHHDSIVRRVKSACYPIAKQDLVLGRAALREFEVDTLPSESLIHLGVRVEPVVDTTPLLLVKDDLEHLAAVFLGPNTLTDNLDRVDEVAENRVVDSSECSRTRALLSLGGARAVGALGAGEDTAGSDHEDMAVGELLLELACQAVQRISRASLCNEKRCSEMKTYRCCTLWNP